MNSTKQRFRGLWERDSPNVSYTPPLGQDKKISGVYFAVPHEERPGSRPKTNVSSVVFTQTCQEMGKEMDGAGG